MSTIISLKNIAFTYPREEGMTEDFAPVYTDLNIDLPAGVTSLVGQNGTGKSTLMLLASGRYLPNAGSVEILGNDTRSMDEQKLQELVSYIYQNMEFETDESVGELLEYVYQNGFWEEHKADQIAEIVKAFELEALLHKTTAEISKGEMQRTIIAFSLLYGSKIVMMDEPVFALEDYQKQASLEYTLDFAHRHNQSIIYSAHELDLTKKYSDNLMLFYKDGTIELGPTKELFKKEHIEEVFQVPYDLLKRKESLFRDVLNGAQDSDQGIENPQN